MSIDLQTLEQGRSRYETAECASNTISVYAYGWRHFTAWCEQAGVVSLPCDPSHAALYFVAVLEKGLKIATAVVHLAAISHFHKTHGHRSPVDESVRHLVQCAKRKLKEKPKPKRAITVEQLKQILMCCETKVESRTARDRAIFLLGFSSGLRRSELVALDLEDIEIVPAGIQIQIRYSKTDQLGAGRILGVHRGKTEETCPVRAVERWMKFRGNFHGPLFVPLSSHGNPVKIRMCKQRVALLVQRAAERIGLNAKHYGGHSLRSGCVTTAVLQGASVFAIMKRTGHRSVQTIYRYVRITNIFESDPLAGAL